MAEPRIRRGDGYELQAGPELIDASVFQFLLGSAREQARPADAAARLEQALAVWRGPVLADVPPSAGVSAWAARLEQERIGAYERRLELSLDLGEVPVVADEAARLVRSYPLREGLWRTLITALYRSGRRAEALDAYQRAYRLLTEELGVEPGPQRRPIDALARFLPSLGVAAERIPSDVDAAAALFRSVVADRRLLIVLAARLLGHRAETSKHESPFMDRWGSGTAVAAASTAKVGTASEPALSRR